MKSKNATRNGQSVKSERPITFTEDEVAAAILEAVNSGEQTGDAYCEPGCITRGLIIERHGCTPYRADKTLKDMLKAGKLRRAWVELVDGWNCKKKVKGYRLT